MTKHKAIRASVTRNGYARDRTQVPEVADKGMLRREFGIARRPRGQRRRLTDQIIEQEERRG